MYVHQHKIISYRIKILICFLDCVAKGNFRCSSTHCIKGEDVCDGKDDCNDGLDEKQSCPGQYIFAI